MDSKGTKRSGAKWATNNLILRFLNHLVMLLYKDSVKISPFNVNTRPSKVHLGLRA